MVLSEFRNRSLISVTGTLQVVVEADYADMPPLEDIQYSGTESGNMLYHESIQVI